MYSILLRIKLFGMSGIRYIISFFFYSLNTAPYINDQLVKKFCLNKFLIEFCCLQAYPHKILTGRRSRMHTIRQTWGLAGFPKREESKHDAFGAGHSSTSISAGLGTWSELLSPSGTIKDVVVVKNGNN